MNLGSIIGSASVTENFLLGGVKHYRTVVLQTDNEKLTLPVTPWKYSVSTSQNNKIVDILDFGENVIMGNAKLKRLKVSCFFPATFHEYSFVVGDIKTPDECIDLITKWKESRKPTRVIVTESPVNLMVVIEELNFREKDGSRDIYYELQLIEHRDWNIPPANYRKQIDEQTGLKSRSTTGLDSFLQNSLINRWATDALERSKYAYGNFSNLGTFQSKNSIPNLSSFKIGSWSW